MNKVEKLFSDIGSDGVVFFVGWLSGIVGAILGLLVALK